MIYCDGLARETERVVWPLAVAFFGPVWLLATWCELRDDFRSFPLDRIIDLTVLNDSYELRPDRTIDVFLVNG
jgi:predicted DNA-binding transcriptional regulator YafY